MRNEVARGIFRKGALLSVLAVFGLSGSTAASQAWQCRPPANLSRPIIENPAPSEIRRTAVDGYILALSWSPQHCRGKRRNKGQSQNMQCDGSIGDFGFILHGLWPEAKGPNYPQYCRKAAVLPRAVVTQNICMTPDVQLLQHEWAKHGTCMTRRPETYFKAAKLMFDAVQYPDMDRLSRQGDSGRALTVQGLNDAFVSINEGLPAKSIRVQTGNRGWLQEVRLCLGKDFKPRACPAYVSGARPSAPLKIWRGG